ncbi:MAG: hypothetical protein AAFU66_09120 [Pseudomonadota bacterium]
MSADVPQIQVPESIQRLALAVRDQDNVGTHHPIFVVRTTRSDLAAADECDGYQVDSDEGPVSPVFDTEKEASAYVKDEGDDGLTIVRVVLRPEPIAFFLTRDGAQQYIDENRHNLNRPDVYAFSLYRCHEMVDLRQWLVALAEVIDAR